jgi:hypothetical protein
MLEWLSFGIMFELSLVFVFYAEARQIITKYLAG